MATLNVISIAERERKKKEDKFIYNVMVWAIEKSIKNSGIEILVDKQQTDTVNCLIIKGKDSAQTYALIDPVSAGDCLFQIDIRVRDKRVFEPIKKTAGLYKDKYHFLNSIDIETYF